ncbi:MAG: hypothetical protein IJ468_04845 [Lachnospiraceae bacterium]|nr:hypothetical protein [Lachnospiraceae bacterium]
MLKKGSDFRVRILPWICVGIGTVATAVLIIGKLVMVPELLSIFYTLLLAAAGLAAGFVLIRNINKKPYSKRDYFAMNGTMILCWVGSLAVILTVTEMSWVYLVCLPVSTFCITFYIGYIPKRIALLDEIKRRESMHRS